MSHASHSNIAFIKTILRSYWRYSMLIRQNEKNNHSWLICRRVGTRARAESSCSSDPPLAGSLRRFLQFLQISANSVRFDSIRRPIGQSSFAGRGTRTQECPGIITMSLVVSDFDYWQNSDSSLFCANLSSRVYRRKSCQDMLFSQFSSPVFH